MSLIARLPPAIMPNLPLSVLSSIFGSISLACWIVVFSPQIAINFKRQSTKGLSTFFLIIWLLGDVFNVIGAVLQGVLPTMVVLAVYYTVADIILLMQCWWYKGLEPICPEQGERTRLLDDEESQSQRRPSLSSILSHAEHLSPAVPLITGDDYYHHQHHHQHLNNHPAVRQEREERGHHYGAILSPPSSPSLSLTPSQDEPRSSTIRSILINSSAIVTVCSAGILGWYLSQLYAPPSNDLPFPTEPPGLSFWGQTCGYICAVLYLASRIPQILLNYKRKSTDGVSVLFFLFACVGNGMYVASILAYETPCSQAERGCADDESKKQYLHNLLVNSSWLAGSLGTLLLDFVVLAQFVMYGINDDSDSESGSDSISRESDGL